MSQKINISSGNTISRKKRVKKPRIYWTTDTQDAVKQYLSLDYNHLQSKLDKYIVDNHLNDPASLEYIDDGYIAQMKSDIAFSTGDTTIQLKENIFRDRIRVPLNRLIENIIFTFKLFRYDIDVKTIHNDCMSHVYEKFYKFDPEMNTNSFSYFGTIAKHYLQNRLKELHNSKKTDLSFEDYKQDADEKYSLEGDGSEETNEIIQLFYYITQSFDDYIDSKMLNDNDKRLLSSIIDLFENHEKNIDDDKYNKTMLQGWLLENSKLTKEEMSKSMNKIKNLYKEKRREFFNNKDSFTNDEFDL